MSSRQNMLSEGLVNGLAVRRLVRQPDMVGYRHQAHAVVRVLNGARLASRASKHAHVRLAPKFTNNAIGD